MQILLAEKRFGISLLDFKNGNAVPMKSQKSIFFKSVVTILMNKLFRSIDEPTASNEYIKLLSRLRCALVHQKWILDREEV